MDIKMTGKIEKFYVKRLAVILAVSLLLSGMPFPDKIAAFAEEMQLPGEVEGTVSGDIPAAEASVQEPAPYIASTADVSGNVVDENGNNYRGAEIYLTGYGQECVTTDENGKYSFQIEKNQAYRLTVSAGDRYEKDGKDVNVTEHTYLGVWRLRVRQFQVTTETDGHGAAIPESQPVEFGSGADITIQPDSGYNIEEITVDGNGIRVEDLTPVTGGDGSGQYLCHIENVTQNQKVTVRFAEYESVPAESIELVIDPAQLVSEDTNTGTYVLLKDAVCRIKPAAGYTDIRCKGEDNTWVTEGSGEGLVIDRSFRIKQVQVFRQNKWYNVSINNEITVIIDKTPPVLTVSGEYGDWYNEKAAVSGFVSDDGTTDKFDPSSGPEKIIWYMTGPDSGAPGEVSGEVKLDRDGKFVFFADRMGEYHIYALDRSGNRSEEVTVSIKIDTAAPEITGFEFDKIEQNALERMINKLSFGIFFNDSIKVTVTGQDPAAAGTPASGLNQAQLYSDGNPVGDPRKVENGQVEFRLTPEEFGGTEISVSMSDIAGNEICRKPSEIEGGTESSFVMLEKNTPEILFSKGGQDYKIDINGTEQYWYKNSAEVLVTVSDGDSGIGSDAVRADSGKLIQTGIVTSEKDDRQIYGKRYLVKFGLGNGTGRNGENRITVSVSDNAGNIAEEKESVYLDGKKPEIYYTKEEPSFTAVRGDGNGGSLQYWYKDSTTVQAAVSDGDSGIGFEEIQVSAGDVELTETKANTENPDQIYEKTYSVKFDTRKPDIRSGGHRIITSARDNVGNESSEEFHIYVDGREPEIALEKEEPTYSTLREENGENVKQDWYCVKTELKITVSDGDSGIESVEILLNGRTPENLEKETPQNARPQEPEYSEKYALMLDPDSAETNQGENVVSVIVKDNVGHESIGEYRVYMDTQLPEVTEVELSLSNQSPVEKLLNFLTFGNFFNAEVRVEVTARDRYPGAGIKCVQLTAGQENWETEDITVSNVDGAWLVSTAAFTLPGDRRADAEALFMDREIKVSAEDHLGWRSDDKGIAEFNGDIKSNRLIVEAVKPEIIIAPEAPAAYVENGKAWYPGDIGFTVTARDEHSGIRGVEMKINGSSLEKDIDGREIAEKFYARDEMSFREAYRINTSQGKRGADGSYRLEAAVTDNAGNEWSRELTVYKDTEAPAIAGFTFSAQGYQEGDGENPGVEVTDYGFYFRENTRVTVTASDSGPSAGVHTISYYTADLEKGISAVTTEAVDDKNQVSFTVPAEFKGQIYAIAEDYVGNHPLTADREKLYVNPDSAIVESGDKHLSEQHITFGKAYTGDTDTNGRELYSGNVDVTVTVSDTFSGIRSVEWTVTAPYDTGHNQEGTVSVDNDGSFAGDGGAWSAEKTDGNLVTQMSTVIAVSNNSNAVNLWVRMTDRAGNTSENSITFSIDKTAPVIEISFDNNTPDTAYQEYYKDSRRAVILIRERNFQPGDVLTEITNTFGVIPTVSGWSASDDDQNPDNTTHTATVLFEADGDYKMTVNAKDSCGNKAAAISAPPFTIDKTLPVIQVKYDNMSSLHGNYYREDRTAAITVTEHNFDSSRLTVTGIAANGNREMAYPTVGGWTSSGDTHTAYIHYTADGKYQFSVDFMDMAGNKSADYTPEEFYLDKQPPEITISGVDAEAAYNGEIKPVVRFSDSNFDVQGISLALDGAINGPAEINGSALDIADGRSFTITNFEDLKNPDLDDVYTLRAVLTDLAGNEVTQETRFSVNRFGSVYIWENKSDMSGKWLQEAQDVIIEETNVDKLDRDSVVIKMTYGTSTGELEEGKDYTVKESGREGSWKQYTYVVGKELFEGDGTYRLTFYSRDKAGNFNENEDDDKLRLARASEITFGVDKTAPVVTAINLNPGETYPNKEYKLNEQNEYPAKITVKDNMELELVTVYLNGNQVECEENGGVYLLPLSLSNSKQEVKIVAADGAGNNTLLTVDGLLVSTNAFVRWLNNPVLLWSTLGTAGAAAGGLLVLRRKRLHRVKTGGKSDEE